MRSGSECRSKRSPRIIPGIFQYLEVGKMKGNLCRRQKKQLVRSEESRKGFPGGLMVENLPADAGDKSSIPGRGRFHMPQATKPVHYNY